MYKYIYKIFIILFLVQCFMFAQFGQNKVQYKDFTWYYIQTDHFDIYFSQKGSALAIERIANSLITASSSVPFTLSISS